jgi:hypothetical protein
MKIPQELQTVLDDFERRNVWGQLQLDFVAGKISVIRKSETQKFSQITGDIQRGNNKPYLR